MHTKKYTLTKIIITERTETVVDDKSLNLCTDFT